MAPGCYSDVPRVIPEASGICGSTSSGQSEHRSVGHQQQGQGTPTMNTVLYFYNFIMPFIIIMPFISIDIL